MAFSSRIVDLESPATCDLDGNLGKLDRRQRTGRFVGKVAREPGGVGDHAAPFETAFGGRDLFGRDDERERLEGIGVAGVVTCEAVAGPPETFDRRQSWPVRPRCRAS